MDAETPLRKKSIEEDEEAALYRADKPGGWCCCCLYLLLFLISSAAAVTIPIVIIKLRHKSPVLGSRAINLVCSATRFPEACNSALSSNPIALKSLPQELTNLAITSASQAVTDTLTQCRNLSAKPEIIANVTLASILDDCFELLEWSLGQLEESATAISSTDLKDLEPDFDDIKTSLSGALTLHGTCTDGISQIISIDGINLVQKGKISFQKLSNSLAFVNTLATYGDAVQDWKPSFFQTHSGIPSAPSPTSPAHRKLLSSSSQTIDNQLAEILFSTSASPSFSAFDKFSLLRWLSFLLHSSSSPFSFFLQKWLIRADRNLPEYPNVFSSSSCLFDEVNIPRWIDRRLLESSVDPNVTVAQDGSGDFETVQKAVDGAPIDSSRRYVIYIKAGTYDEIVRFSKATKNVVFLGDGINKTIISGNLNVQLSNITTFKSATVGVAGKGFVAKGITFQNTAGAIGHQAVPLRVSADQSAFWQCSLDGFQDTLHAHAFRQFYKECTIYGTVDFVFGNAAAVFQNCTLLARTPLLGQQNVYTAQGRTDPGQNTGFAIQDCTLDGTGDLLAAEYPALTYLGRPWKPYSLTVYLKSTLSSVIDPSGWLPWSGDFALDTLYYAEYANQGPGAYTPARVNWTTQITDPLLVSKFTVGNFLSAGEWLPDTDIPYTDSL